MLLCVVVVICGVLSVDLRRVVGMLSIIFLPASLPANPAELPTK